MKQAKNLPENQSPSFNDDSFQTANNVSSLTSKSKRFSKQDVIFFVFFFHSDFEGVKNFVASFFSPVVNPAFFDRPRYRRD